MAFSYLPICGLVSSRVFCMHGGLSPNLKTFDQLRAMKLPFDPPDGPSLINDVLWSDPDPSVKGNNKLYFYLSILSYFNKISGSGYQLSHRGIAYLFGVDVVRNFCQKFNIDLIARAHQVVENGYEFFADRKLVTLFSAPNYCGEFDNCAGTMTVSDTLACKIRVSR